MIAVLFQKKKLRAPLIVSDEEDFMRTWKLVHDRSPGRHTPVAQNHLGAMYDYGKGVKQDYAEAVEWYQRAAEQGYEAAQHNLGVKYANGQGVPRHVAEAVKWFQLSAAQGQEEALKALGIMQQEKRIPTPPPGTTVTTILLTSAASAKYNNRAGIVVTPTEGTTIKPGRAAVLLGGEAKPISLKPMNLRV